MRFFEVLRGLLCAVLLAGLVVACGSSGSGGGGSPAVPEIPPPGDGDGDGGDGGDDDGGDEDNGGDDDDGTVEADECDSDVEYGSTWEAVQEIVIARNGCLESACHGDAASGGLDLRPEVAYDNLLQVPSSGSSLQRITPGDKDRSYFWLKLAAKTLPDEFSGYGSPMPTGRPAISENDLELTRRWIYGGAPEFGTTLETEELVGGCLPPVEPLAITPLPPPAPGEGIQLVMPPWLLDASSEHEVCFASYFDISDQVPDEALVDGGRRFRYWSSEMRQDPQSHHLLVNRSSVVDMDLNHPDFGGWTCKVGAQLGEDCNPLDLSACGGNGSCATPFVDGFACFNFGPRGAGLSFLGTEGLPGGSQAAQSFTEYPAGVYSTMPVRGLILWNSHAFNLTSKDHMMNARINVYFAGPENADIATSGIFDISNIFGPDAAPFEESTLCNEYTFPENAHLYSLSSHTHQRGKHFTADLPDGTRIYENFIYNDPLDKKFDPPMVFDSSDPAERTITFCSLYNNGRNPDGSPNVDEVTRYSRLPQSVFQPGVPGRCSPVACVNPGMVGEACGGVGDDAACDTSPGADDGWCDACRITGGESTENEMFLPLGRFYVP